MLGCSGFNEGTWSSGKGPETYRNVGSVRTRVWLRFWAIYRECGSDYCFGLAIGILTYIIGKEAYGALRQILQSYSYGYGLVNGNVMDDELAAPAQSSLLRHTS